MKSIFDVIGPSTPLVPFHPFGSSSAFSSFSFATRPLKQVYTLVNPWAADGPPETLRDPGGP